MNASTRCINKAFVQLAFLLSHTVCTEVHYKCKCSSVSSLLEYCHCTTFHCAGWSVGRLEEAAVVWYKGSCASGMHVNNELHSICLPPKLPLGSCPNEGLCLGVSVRPEALSSPTTWSDFWSQHIKTHQQRQHQHCYTVSWACPPQHLGKRFSCKQHRKCGHQHR